MKWEHYIKKRRSNNNNNNNKLTSQSFKTGIKTGNVLVQFLMSIHLKIVLQACFSIFHTHEMHNAIRYKIRLTENRNFKRLPYDI